MAFAASIPNCALDWSAYAYNKKIFWLYFTYRSLRNLPKLLLQNTYEPRSDKRDLLAIKVKSEIFTEKERPSCCEQLQKI